MPYLLWLMLAPVNSSGWRTPLTSTFTEMGWRGSAHVVNNSTNVVGTRRLASGQPGRALRPAFNDAEAGPQKLHADASGDANDTGVELQARRSSQSDASWGPKERTRSRAHPSPAFIDLKSPGPFSEGEDDAAIVSQPKPMDLLP